MKNNVYNICPTYTGDKVMLRRTNLDDAASLLACYSDPKAVPLFNSDNCHGDDFYYQTMERMIQAIEFWNFSYEKKYFVRWTIITNNTNTIIGTVEMFHRSAEDEFNDFGILRIDLQSAYEKREYINDILEIANKHFYTDFDVEDILTKAIPSASERISALRHQGYVSINKKFMIYDDYFVRKRF